MHHVAEALVALGGAFLVCGLIARAGVPIGLPTIPLFMVAGIIFGPHTPGLALVEDPADLELIARLGLVFLLFYLGLEFSLDQLTAGGSRLVTSAGVYLVLNIGGGLVFGFSLGWGLQRLWWSPVSSASRRRRSSPNCWWRRDASATLRPGSSSASS